MLEEQNIVNKKNRTIIVIIVTMTLFFLIVGISYAYWQKTKVQSDKNIFLQDVLE